ncbi:MAG: dephospho-CoA kinase [bacterium]|nr:dephospho-CoA kinase [bacterium]
MIIGITGRVGSGKSRALSIVKKYFHYESIDLDEVGHALLEREDIKKRIVFCFGRQVLDEAGCIDRKVLGDIVFSDETRLMHINTIMHNNIREVTLKQVDSLIKSKYKDIVIVGALIKETGLKSICDHIVVIDAEDDTISSKIGKKALIMKYQRNRDEYLHEADGVIFNSFDQDFEFKCKKYFAGIMEL